MRLRPEDLGSNVDTNGFVPMRKCKGYFGSNEHDFESCPYKDCERHKSISGVYKKLGLLDDVRSLPREQQEKLLGITYRSTFDDLQRDFVEAGLRTGLRLIGTDGHSCQYVGVRGSTSRGAATAGDDVDLFIIADNPNRVMKHATEIAREEGNKLKKKHPETTRSEKNIVAPFVIGSEWLGHFMNDPLFIDSDQRFLEYSSNVQLERVMKMQEVLARMLDSYSILDHSDGDPFEFARRAIQPGNRIFGLKEKDRTHNMIALLTRLYGIEVQGKVPQFDITRLRDAYIFSLFGDL